jgi:hypothetical protein
VTAALLTFGKLLAPQVPGEASASEEPSSLPNSLPVTLEQSGPGTASLPANSQQAMNLHPSSTMYTYVPPASTSAPGPSSFRPILPNNLERARSPPPCIPPASSIVQGVENASQLAPVDHSRPGSARLGVNDSDLEFWGRNHDGQNSLPPVTLPIANSNPSSHDGQYRHSGQSTFPWSEIHLWASEKLDGTQSTERAELLTRLADLANSAESRASF